MQSRFFTFMVLAALVMMIQMWVIQKLYPPPARPQADPAAEVAQLADGQPAAGEQPAGQPRIDGAPAPADNGELQPPVVQMPLGDDALDGAVASQPEQWISLGSLDPESGYRMLVTFTTRGAAVARVELNNPRYREIDDWAHGGGYLTAVIEATEPDVGCLVPIVGEGTPAARAGIQAGDLLVEVNGKATPSLEAFQRVMYRTRAGRQIPLVVERDGKRLELKATLTHRPLELMAPENGDPLSLLATLDSLDRDRIPAGQQELPGLAMREGNWRLLEAADAPADSVAFAYDIPSRELQLIKRYQVIKVPTDKLSDENFPAYHLNLTLELRNTSGSTTRQVAYRLDGPTGLPTEGFWYSNKISRNWGAAGMRDVITFSPPNSVGLVSTAEIADQSKLAEPTNSDRIWQGAPLGFTGIDVQYFASVIIPQSDDPQQQLFAKWMPIRVGEVNKDLKSLTNTSVRLVSKSLELAPGDSASQSFQVFAGPKRPELLDQYGLHEVVYYGWFDWVAKPMLAILHFFYSIIPNYGVAIILLTVLVRSCMFPISRKQAINAQKMQELQPEIKRIAEKYKGNLELRTKAQQELFRKHNYNPLAGCLPMFLQLPIFLGLYRSLAVDVELRQAPLISENIRWASNLGAPDMFWFWEPYLPAFLAGPNGWLGPYLNILPLITIALFIWQQKMFMPPPTDEQSALQQKMMQYMMVIVGVMFFKVPSGLCLYFIVSSLWGIAERKLLPKTLPVVTRPGEEPAGRAATAAAIEKPTASDNATTSDKADNNNHKKRRKSGR